MFHCLQPHVAIVACESFKIRSSIFCISLLPPSATLPRWHTAAAGEGGHVRGGSNNRRWAHAGGSSSRSWAHTVVQHGGSGAGSPRRGTQDGGGGASVGTKGWFFNLIFYKVRSVARTWGDASERPLRPDIRAEVSPIFILR